MDVFWRRLCVSIFYLRKGDLFDLSWVRVQRVMQGSISSELLMCGSSYRCCMFVSWVHPVAVFNAAFCMTYSLLMLVEDARGDHTDGAYSRAGLITAL